jgi:hypothetical protein
VSFFRPKFLLLAMLAALVASLSASGCSGAAFTAGDGASSGGSAGTSGSAGSGQTTAGTTSQGPGKACAGPEDCDDKDPCTADLCDASGSCDTSPKCAGTQKCCEGDCAECCDNADCDDHLDCTENRCFMGQCMFVPDDTQCAATEYCSAKGGCRARQTCGILMGADVAAECDDDSTCTTDECVSNLCTHTYCTGTLCCEGQNPGCAEECCNDSQCDKDTDPCTVGSCEGGKCSVKPLCGGGTECCKSADGKTATCGVCCSADECDDKVGCTKDSCGGGQCSHTLQACPEGYYCDPTPGHGCMPSPDCSTNADCAKQAGACQLNARCDNGTCQFDSCPDNASKCCSSGCAVCCDDKECSDNIDCTKDTCGAGGCTHTPDDSLCMGGHCSADKGCVACRDKSDCDDGVSCTDDSCTNNTCVHFSNCASGFCDATSNACVQCTYDSDCQGGVVNSAGAQANIIGTPCKVSKCVKGMCQDSTITCTGEQRCCSPYGCSIVCGIMTQ